MHIDILHAQVVEDGRCTANVCRFVHDKLIARLAPQEAAAGADPAGSLDGDVVMREILSDVDRWRAAGEPVAVATVVATWGSAPRGVGAKYSGLMPRRSRASTSSCFCRSQTAKPNMPESDSTT